MKNCIALFLVFVCTILNAQYNVDIPSYDHADWKAFKNSTVYVLLPDTNNILKSAVEKYWTVTPFKFIGVAEFKELSENPNNFFLADLKYNVPNPGGTAYSENYLAIFKGTRSGISLKGEYAGFNIIKKNAIFDMDYREPLMVNVYVKYLNGLYDVVMKSQIKSNKEYFNYIELQKATIKQKPLYVIEEGITEKASLADVKKVYSGEIVVMNFDQYQELMKSNQDVNFYSANGDDFSKCQVRVFNIKTGELLFTGFHGNTRGCGLIPYEVEKWSK